MLERITRFLCAVFCLIWIGCRNEHSTTESQIDTESSRTPSAELATSSAEYQEARQLTDRLLEDTQLAATNSWHALPDWLDPDDVPFATEQYFGLSTDENGFQHCLRAHLRSSFADSILLLPKELQPSENDWRPDLKRLHKLNNKISRTRSRLLDFVYQADREGAEEYFDANVDNHLEHVRPIIDELQNASGKENTFIPCDFSLDALPPIAFRGVARDLTILVIRKPESHEALEALRLTLELEQHVRKLGSYTIQMLCDAIVWFATQNQALAILQATQDSTRVKQVIEILKEAAAQRQQTPGFIELAKFEHLQLRKLIHEMKTDSVAFEPDSFKYISMDPTAPKSVVVHNLMSIDVFGGYMVNSEFALNHLEKTFDDQPELIAKIKTQIEEHQFSQLKPWNIFGPMLLPIVVNTFDSMSDKDYKFELEILNRRYQEIEALESNSVSEQLSKLAELEKHWTTDESWKATKLLKWYRPQPKLRRIASRSRLLIAGTTAIACVRKFQLENQGEYPQTLEMTIKNQPELSDYINDPFTGRPFKLNFDDRNVTLYSVGPDQIDNDGGLAFSPDDFNCDMAGDIHFPAVIDQ